MLDYESLATYLKEKASVKEIAEFLREIDKNAERMLKIIEEAKKLK